MIEPIQHAVKHVNGWFVAPQQRESLVHAFVSPQDRATLCTDGGVGADSARAVLSQPTERGPLQLTGGRVTCLECF